MAHLAIDLHTMDDSAQQILLLLADCGHVHEPYYLKSITPNPYAMHLPVTNCR